MLRPINNHVAIKLDDTQEPPAGIVLPEAYNNRDGFQIGHVKMTARECEHLLGKQVMFPMYDGISVVSEGQAYVLIQSSKIAAVIQ